MKKVILCLSPIMVGLLSGAFFEFFLQALALMSSPFVDPSLGSYLNLCVIISVVLFLFIAFFDGEFLFRLVHQTVDVLLVHGDHEKGHQQRKENVG